MKKLLLALALMVATAPVNASSLKASALLGATRARACFDAAAVRDTGPSAMRMCNLALQEDALSDADRVATFVNRGILHMHGRDTPAALADYEQAIRLDAGSAEAWVNKGLALLRADRDADAAEAITRGIDLGPANLAVAYYSRAFAFEAIGRVRDAYEDFGRAAALAPDWPQPAEQLSRFKTVRVITAGV